MEFMVTPVGEMVDHLVTQSNSIRLYLKILRFVDKPGFCDARLLRVAGSGVQDICSMKPRFRNANLLITHVLDIGLVREIPDCVTLMKCSGSVCGDRNG